MMIYYFNDISDQLVKYVLLLFKPSERTMTIQENENVVLEVDLEMFNFEDILSSDNQVYESRMAKKWHLFRYFILMVIIIILSSLLFGITLIMIDEQGHQHDEVDTRLVSIAIKLDQMAKTSAANFGKYTLIILHNKQA